MFNARGPGPGGRAWTPEMAQQQVAMMDKPEQIAAVRPDPLRPRATGLEHACLITRAGLPRCLRLSLPLSHVSTLPLSHSRTLSRSHSHTLTLSHSLTLSFAHSLTLSLTLSWSNFQHARDVLPSCQLHDARHVPRGTPLSLSLSFSLSLSLFISLSHPLTLTLALSMSLSLSLALSLSLSHASNAVQCTAYRGLQRDFGNTSYADYS